jgi:hypothetical protein
MSFEVLIVVEPPEGDDWPPPSDVFTAWAATVRELVKSIGGSRTLDVYGPEYLDGWGRPAPKAEVNVWTDGYPGTWSDALEYVGQRVTALEAAGFDISIVEIIPGRHLIAIA